MVRQTDYSIANAKQRLRRRTKTLQLALSNLVKNGTLFQLWSQVHAAQQNVYNLRRRLYRIQNNSF